MNISPSQSHLGVDIWKSSSDSARPRGIRRTSRSDLQHALVAAGMEATREVMLGRAPTPPLSDALTRPQPNASDAPETTHTEKTILKLRIAARHALKCGELSRESIDAIDAHAVFAIPALALFNELGSQWLTAAADAPLSMPLALFADAVSMQHLQPVFARVMQLRDDEVLLPQILRTVRSLIFGTEPQAVSPQAASMAKQTYQAIMAVLLHRRQAHSQAMALLWPKLCG